MVEVNIYDRTASCLCCAHGEHEACRHYPDGRRYENSDKSKPCRCEQEGHPFSDGTCMAWSQDNWSSWRCGRPVKAEITVRRRFGWGIDDPMVTIPVCGIHRAAHERKMKGDAKREAEFQARKAKWARDASNSKAAADWAERFGQEFGIEARSASDAEAIRISISPEEVYAKLSEAQKMLDEVYGDDHPLRG